MPSVSFDASSLHSLARSIDEAAVRVQAESMRTVWAVGAEVATAAKAEAKKHSTSIPPTVKFEALPGAAVVHAGNPDVKLAVLYEFGNHKKARRGVKFAFRATGFAGPVTRAQHLSGMSSRKGFAHPVFGNKDVWVTQESHPFLRPTFKVMRRGITVRMKKSWEETLRPLDRR